MCAINSRKVDNLTEVNGFRSIVVEEAVSMLLQGEEWVDSREGEPLAVGTNDETLQSSASILGANTTRSGKGTMSGICDSFITN